MDTGSQVGKNKAGGEYHLGNQFGNIWNSMVAHSRHGDNDGNTLHLTTKCEIPGNRLLVIARFHDYNVQS
jgi:hypothetical protein